MTQPTFYPAFDNAELSRRSDPVTSQLAGQSKRESGSALSDCEAILSVLRRRDGLTAGEIARELGHGWDNVRVSRRIGNLREFVECRERRVCKVNGTLMQTWWKK